MEARRRTWFDERGIALDGGSRTLPVYAGAMHYWRVDPARWATCLRALHATGLTIVETSVPWRVHEPARGALDWIEERDLGRFLDLARAAGLGVIVRPGPIINDELTGFGLPDWVLADPECQARTARGTPAYLPAPPRAFPIPSFASRAFLAHVRAWYAAVAEVVRGRLSPDGPVVAFGVDGVGFCYRLGAFDLDYHPDALAWWRDASGLDEPPREYRDADAARCVLWLKAKDEYVGRALGELARALDEVGLGELARFHTLAPGHHDVRRVQTAIGGPAALAASSPREQFSALRRRGAALAGTAAPLPLCEVGVGSAPWLPPLDHGDPARERDQLLALLACGARGFEIAMAVERDRHWGAAISAGGAIEAAWLPPLLAALAEVDWTSLRRRAGIALVDTRADTRFGVATNLIDPVSPLLAEVVSLGPGGAAELGTDPHAVFANRWHVAVARALELAQVPFHVVDEATPEDELAHYRVVIAPTGARVDRGLWQRLRALVEHKRAIVVIGPATPTRDELDQPLHEPAPKRLGRLQEGSLDDVAGLADDLAQLAGDASDAWHVERPDDVRAFAFADGGDRTRVLFVVSDADRAASAVVLADDRATALRDPFTRETIAIDAGRATLAMPPRGVRMLVVD